jgi:hypothetical protein
MGACLALPHASGRLRCNSIRRPGGQNDGGARAQWLPCGAGCSGFPGALSLSALMGPGSAATASHSSGTGIRGAPTTLVDGGTSTSCPQRGHLHQAVTGVETVGNELSFLGKAYRYPAVRSGTSTRSWTNMMQLSSRQTDTANTMC